MAHRVVLCEHVAAIRPLAVEVAARLEVDDPARRLQVHQAQRVPVAALARWEDARRERRERRLAARGAHSEPLGQVFARHQRRHRELMVAMAGAKALDRRLGRIPGDGGDQLGRQRYRQFPRDDARPRARRRVRPASGPVQSAAASRCSSACDASPSWRSSGSSGSESTSSSPSWMSCWRSQFGTSMRVAPSEADDRREPSAISEFAREPREFCGSRRGAGAADHLERAGAALGHGLHADPREQGGARRRPLVVVVRLVVDPGAAAVAGGPVLSRAHAGDAASSRCTTGTAATARRGSRPT